MRFDRRAPCVASGVGLAFAFACASHVVFAFALLRPSLLAVFVALVVGIADADAAAVVLCVALKGVWSGTGTGAAAAPSMLPSALALVHTYKNSVSTCASAPKKAGASLASTTGDAGVIFPRSASQPARSSKNCTLLQSRAPSWQLLVPVR